MSTKGSPVFTFSLPAGVAARLLDPWSVTPLVWPPTFFLGPVMASPFFKF